VRLYCPSRVRSLSIIKDECREVRAANFTISRSPGQAGKEHARFLQYICLVRKKDEVLAPQRSTVREPPLARAILRIRFLAMAT
jgi:hypothetical protein